MMTNSPVSGSELPRSSHFELLHPKIRKWIWDAGWSELRDVQEQAIPVIIEGKCDVLIAASTASGKTEAAFLPILSALLRENSVSVVLYISPLKALINDQWERLEGLCEQLDIPVVPWHGDVSDTRKRRFLEAPQGILLITPESLEALLMNRGHHVAGLMGGLRYIVIDELHAFMGTERGRQLQSLMHRVETVLKRTVPRVGLSATLGDMTLAAEFLRAGGASSVIESRDGGQELKVIIKGYLNQSSALSHNDIQELEEKSSGAVSPEGTEAGVVRSISEHLYQTLRGTKNLIFPNSRGQVECYADLLRERCEQDGVPREFWPHHGSLSKEVREEAEAALKTNQRPATAICTTTLELGIDIGSVKSIAQIGAAPSVASLRQRLGRSGRKKGEPAILRCYVIEDSIGPGSHLVDQLRHDLVLTIAQIRLLITGWYEPPRIGGLHLSTMVQQLLSSLVQYGGLTAKDIWSLLISNGPFNNLTQREFADLLRCLAERDVLIQDSRGMLLLGPMGERIAGHYSFYAAFNSDEEFRLVWGSKSLGSLPIAQPLEPGSYIVFAGRRWQVQIVDAEKKIIAVTPGHAGLAPQFGGGRGKAHDRVREEMRLVVAGTDRILFLDARAQDLLDEARKSYSRLNLDHSILVPHGNEIAIFLWRGDWIQDTIVLLLRTLGVKAENHGCFVSARGISAPDLVNACASLAANPPDENLLTRSVLNKEQQKWDFLLPEALMARSYASQHLDIEGAIQELRKIIRIC